MNERLIKETANEILANLIHKPEWDKPCTEKILESFAELIVRECAAYMYEHYPRSRYEINYMRKHMGDPNWNKSWELNDERTI